MTQVLEVEGRVSSYSSIFAMGHRAIASLLDGDVVVEEKLDGSQFSFKVEGGQLLMRSKGKQMVPGAVEKMFSKAEEALLRILPAIPEGLTFRGEYFQKAKHNTLCYERVPQNNIAIYDIDRGDQDFMSPAEKEMVARNLGFEIAPILFQGRITSVE